MAEFPVAIEVRGFVRLWFKRRDAPPYSKA